MNDITDFYSKIPTTKKAYLAEIKEHYGISRISDCEKAIIFGTANLGRRMLKGLCKAGIRIIAFSDNDRSRWGSVVDGVRVIAPSEIKDHAGSMVIIASKFLKDINRQLRKEGISNVVPYYVLNVLFPRLFPDIFYSGAFDALLRGKAKALKAYHMLYDGKSRRVFLGLLEFMSSLDPEKLPAIENHQYFPRELPLLKGGETYVDAGAYVGDTMKEFIARTGGRFERYIALEPDKANFARLRREIPRPYQSRVSALCLGASYRRGYVSFSGSGREDSRISKDGKGRIETARLDDLCRGYSVTSIKIDVEGHETEVLRGARAILKKQQPKLAVCVYHKPEHLWKVPLQISGSNTNYRRYFLRHHEPERYGTVLYAR